MTIIKVYYKLELTLLSPLAIGSGEGMITDSDIALNSRGIPFIPGSAMAGMVRTAFERKFPLRVNDVFGYISDSRKYAKSRVYFFDAVFENQSDSYVAVRDSVALDAATKIAKDGAKFDFEALETGAKAVTYIELDADSDEMITQFDEVMATLSVFTMGAKTTRGYGRIAAIVYRRQFNMSDKCEALKWLEFDLFGDASFDGDNVMKMKGDAAAHKIVINLAVNGSPMIRRYTTDVSIGNANPDYKQLTLHTASPTIPGTSWAGAFRSHILMLGKQCGIADIHEMVDDAFGCVGEKEKKRSKIAFSETVIEGELEEKIIIRTAIDRFTAGASDRALFTEKLYYGGSTTLTIEYGEINKVIEELLKIAICDLHYGILAIGGETSVGHGLFTVTDLNTRAKYIITEQGMKEVNHE